MISEIIVIVISLILAPGHIWWGIQHPIKEMESLGNPTTTLASYHACWYHISIVFIVTAIVVFLELIQQWANSELLWVLWFIIFGCWLPYLWVVLKFPSMRKLGWGQITLIGILLINLGILASGSSDA